MVVTIVLIKELHLLDLCPLVYNVSVESFEVHGLSDLNEFDTLLPVGTKNKLTTVRQGIFVAN